MSKCQSSDRLSSIAGADCFFYFLSLSEHKNKLHQTSYGTCTHFISRLITYFQLKRRVASACVQLVHSQHSGIIPFMALTSNRSESAQPQVMWTLSKSRYDCNTVQQLNLCQRRFSVIQVTVIQGDLKSRATELRV